MDTQNQKKEMPNKWFSSILIGVLVLNQGLIMAVSSDLGIKSGMENMMDMFTIQEASAMEIMMPLLNEDGVTTHLAMMPTITEVPGDKNSSDIVADAMKVMLATGTPFYAPEGISFDDPIGALSRWSSYEASTNLSPELEERFTYLIGVFPCNFCCGSPGRVAVAGRCGCAHAGAARGFFKYMLDQFGDAYTNDELVGEGYRWQALWYPAGVVEDYLLATGRSDVLGHAQHGGVGADGMHGLAQ